MPAACVSPSKKSTFVTCCKVWRKIYAGEKESIEEAYEVASRLCHLHQRASFLIILGDDEEGNYQVCYDGCDSQCESDSGSKSVQKRFLNLLRTELAADKKDLIADLWMKRVCPSTTKKLPPSYLRHHPPSILCWGQHILTHIHASTWASPSFDEFGKLFFSQNPWPVFGRSGCSSYIPSSSNGKGPSLTPSKCLGLSCVCTCSL